jgi:kynurenine formamidase
MELSFRQSSQLRDEPFVSEADVLSYFETLSNWGRWGDDDELGILKLITDDVRRAAVELVDDCETVSCAWPIAFNRAETGRVSLPQRFMLRTGEGVMDRLANATGHEAPSARHGHVDEYIGFMFHGLSLTHLDSPAHVSWDGLMYNNRPASLVTAVDGATADSVTASSEGIVTRGVLLDLPAALERESLDPGTGVTPDMLEDAEQRLGVIVRAGDALMLRTGHGRSRSATGVTQPMGSAPGYDSSCLPWLHERGVAVLASDGPNEMQPRELDTKLVGRNPIHAVGLVAMGLWFVVFCDLEGVSSACATRQHYEFLLTLNPLRLEGCTGSPVNPIAMF